MVAFDDVLELCGDRYEDAERYRLLGLTVISEGSKSATLPGAHKM
jgi:hypothetical protein